MLDGFEISYEITPMDTVIEGKSVEDVFAAYGTKHQAVNTDRVLTSFEIDDQGDRDLQLSGRGTTIEGALGKPPENVIS